MIFAFICVIRGLVLLVLFLGSTEPPLDEKEILIGDLIFGHVCSWCRCEWDWPKGWKTHSSRRQSSLRAEKRGPEQGIRWDGDLRDRSKHTKEVMETYGPGIWEPGVQTSPRDDWGSPSTIQEGMKAWEGPKVLIRDLREGGRTCPYVDPWGKWRHL